MTGICNSAGGDHFIVTDSTLTFLSDLSLSPSPSAMLEWVTIFTAVVVLFFVVLLNLAFRLCDDCVRRRRLRRRHALIQQLIMDVAAPQTDSPTLQPSKKGLDRSVIATLPAFVYMKTGQPNDPGVECIVCLSAVEEGEKARVLTNCNHTFHEQCIDMWLNSNSTCPICRTEAQPREAKGEVEKVEPSKHRHRH